MRIGFVSIYSWRPHVEHLHYLADLIRQAGHEAEFLACDGDFPVCYTRELRNIRPGWQECLMCRAGGLRSFEAKHVSSIGAYTDGEIDLPQDWKSWALSSASKLGRFESSEDYAGQAFNELSVRLQPTVKMAYQAAHAWMSDKHLDALVVFNGRIDATRAIFEAARNKGIPVVSLERTWFGDGLQILPGEICIGLRSVNQMVSEWSEKPLTKSQALKAVSYIASRFLRRNQKEWRAYNTNAKIKPWPIESGRYKILLIPGSINEIWGHPDWSSGWKHPIDAYDALIEHFSLESKDLVLRCHPNWGENIGKADGKKIERYYTDWANQRGVLIIPSTDSTSTLGLIAQSDAIVVSSGSAALEAGALGKQIIAVGAATYEAAGIRDEACSMAALQKLSLWVNLPLADQDYIREQTKRRTLRFAYTITHRIPQFVDYVKCEAPTRYIYKDGGDGGKLIEMLTSGKLMADDNEFAENTLSEDPVLEQMNAQRWEELFQLPDTSSVYRRLKRRFPYAGIDSIRGFMRHGDQ